MQPRTRQLIGGLLMAVGILIAGTTGLCSAVVLLGVFGGYESGAAMGLLPLVAVIGGIPCLGGIGLFLAGRRLVRQAARQGDDTFD